MAAQGATPIDYGLRVRTSPAGLSVTAANKMRRAQRVQLSFSGANPETVLFDVRPHTLRSNEETLSSFLEQVRDEHGKPETKSGNFLWRGVSGDLVAQSFFDLYRSEAMAWRVRPDLISKYIKAALRVGELRDWTVVLVSNKAKLDKDRRPTPHATFAGMDVGLITRSLIPDGEAGVSDGSEGRRMRELKDEHRYAIRRILSPADELIDLTAEQRAAAMELTIARYEEDPGQRAAPPTTPSGPAIRLQRRPDQPLLLIYPLDHSKHEDLVERPMVGFYVSFPHSEKSVTAEYFVNPIWQQLQTAGMAPDEEDE
jgi:hypothetical protein